MSDEIDQESELVVPSVEDGAHEREADGQRAEEDLRRRHVALGLLLVAADHRDGEDQKEGAKELDQERRDRAQMMQKVIERVPAATSLRADGHGGLLVACCLRERERENGSKDRSRCRSIAISTEEQLRCLRSWFLRLFRLFRSFASQSFAVLLLLAALVWYVSLARLLVCLVCWLVVWRRYDYKHVYA